MATITINGRVLAGDDAKTIRRELGKVRRAEEKAAAARQEQCDIARSKAIEIGFNIMTYKARGGDFPRAWRIYRAGDQWANHAFNPVAGEPETTVQCGPQETTVRHYGYNFLGAVTNVSGYTQVIFLRDTCKPEGLEENQAECYAIGTANNGTVHHLAELPGIKMSDFVPAGD